jgi:nitroreductase
MQFLDEVKADFSRRDPAPGVAQEFPSRWSPRAFVRTEISDETVQTLFEAARWAPSCFNEQPWRFYVSRKANFADYLQLLNDTNQVWAANASLMCFAVCKTTFARNSKPNNYCDFDTGAAWMSLTLQARRMGLYTHGMAGIRHEEVAKYLQLGEDDRVICGIAIGVVAPRES